jgi:hypothetical protein
MSVHVTAGMHEVRGGVVRGLDMNRVAHRMA